MISWTQTDDRGREVRITSPDPTEVMQDVLSCMTQISRMTPAEIQRCSARCSASLRMQRGAATGLSEGGASGVCQGRA